MSNRKDKKALSIEETKHPQMRVHIPTEELRGFVTPEQEAPKKLLYPRDTSLDPQLVWSGKDEQDMTDLAVPVLPIYIHDRIRAYAIAEAVRAEARSEAPLQSSLFDDYDNRTIGDLVDFYHSQERWANRMILGDSLLVMASLAEKEGLRNKVQMIYMDPPYGIKFGSNWQVSVRKRDVKDGRKEDMSRQPEQVRAFRDTWQMGIHSYLKYLRDRLVVARDLLSESGSIFLQIGDENVHFVRCLLDEIFGRDNFIAEIIVQKTGSQAGDFLQSINDYICWYVKDKQFARQKFRGLYMPREERDEADYSPDPLTSAGETSGSTFDFWFEGKRFHPGPGAHWKTNRAGMERLRLANRIVAQRDQIRFKRFWGDFPVKSFSNVWTGIGGASDMMYAVQTNTKIIERCILMTTDPGDLVLDPTCGSGTTAYVAEQWGRRWVTSDVSRVALALARTRLMTAKYPYYLLEDSPEGVAKRAELAGLYPPDVKTQGDIKKGFVYKTVPHVTLKSIANNEKIEAIHAHWQEKLETLRHALNDLLGQTWEEWQIPRKPKHEWPEDAQRCHAEWLRFYQERQKEIDAAILRSADPMTLYDQPYEDSSRIRVTGTFTVESLSPSRALDPDEKRPESETDGQKFSTSGQFERMIIDYLKKAGVQNGEKKERLKFDLLEPYASAVIQAAGEYTDASGATRRVAVCIGPEHNVVDAGLVKKAALEARRGLGFDLLIICGFAFDPYAKRDIEYYGNLSILFAHMHPDLLMEEDLLKKTGAGNLFTVYGEPDIDIDEQEDGKLVVTINGLDVYDPTTDELRSHTTDYIVCWFIDTAYNDECFFVRHAYFTGNSEPYEKLKRALRAQVNEDIWKTLYRTRSRPFERPITGKIAIKVINDFGDEVLKVYEIK